MINKKIINRLTEKIINHKLILNSSSRYSYVIRTGGFV